MSRHQISISIEEVEKLGQIGATQAEIAAFFGVSVPTIERRFQKPEYRAAFDRGFANLKLSLRRTQVKQADSGNTTMLIWLGKNLLGQRDNLDTKLTGSGPDGEIQFASADPRERILGRIAQTADPGAATKSS